MDIVVVGQQPWDIEIGCNNKNIALEFSKQHRVLYVNPPLDRITALRSAKEEPVARRMDIIKGKKRGLVKIRHNLWTYYPDTLIESVNWIKINALYQVLNKQNNRKFAQSIRSAVNELGLKDFLLFNDSDMFRSFHLKEMLLPKLSIYYSRDYFQAEAYYKRHGALMEPLLIAKSDLCVANSPFLADFCKKYNPKSFDVGQGCDLELFLNAKTEKPASMQKITGTVIGYAGAIFASRLDISAITLIAESHPEWQVVMVGPEDAVFAGSALHALKNVHFLGAKDPGRLPAYIAHFDVCINPQILNDFTKGNYPRKIDEYLAMGKPVVATGTGAMAMFAEFAYLAGSPEDYPALVERALQEDNAGLREKRKNFAAGHSWANSVGKIYEAITVVTERVPQLKKLLTAAGEFSDER